MRKLLILPVVLLTIASCTKTDTNTSANAAISVDIDGVPTTFNTDAMAVQTNTYLNYSIVISGYQSTALTSSLMSITIGGPSPITVGTYHDIYTGGDVVDLFRYTQQPGSGVYGTIGSGSDTATVIITSIDSTEIQGTFTAAQPQLLFGSTSPSNHNFSNGKFAVKFNPSSNSIGTLTAKVDGVLTTFNSYATAVESSNGTITISGYQGSATSSNELSVSISNNSSIPFTAGSVISDTSTNGNYPSVTYTQEPGPAVYNDANALQTNVTVTAIGSDYVEGTFNSTVDVFTSGSPASHVFTNGTFSVPLTN
jgi:hypothetical protein